MLRAVGQPFEQTESVLHVGDRLAVGEAPLGPLGACAQIAQRAFVVAAPFEMNGELGSKFRRVFPVG